MSAHQPPFTKPWPMHGTASGQPMDTSASAPMEWGFPELFILSQAVLPALLYLPGTQPLRVVIRTAPFLISLAAMAWYGKKSFHARLLAPAQKWLVLCSLCL